MDPVIPVASLYCKHAESGTKQRNYKN